MAGHEQQGIADHRQFEGGTMEKTTPYEGSDMDISVRIRRTPFVDTHEHLVEEEARITGMTNLFPCNDWSVLFQHYIDSDLLVAGMPRENRERLTSPTAEPYEKWRAIEPWWPLVQNTGYGLAVRLAVELLYDIRVFNGTTVKLLAERFQQRIQPGYYRGILRDAAGIESCQVNSLERTFMTTSQPCLLMQDISLLDLHTPEGWQSVAKPTGITVRCLAECHQVIDWWFAAYGPYAVAVKSQAAYRRSLDFEDIAAEEVEAPYQRMLNGDALNSQDRKRIEDHLFWYGVRKATEYDLPVKLHTGYLAGHNGMPMARLAAGPGEITDLLARAPDTRFVLMHIGYPYHEAMIAIAKHWHNAYIDMCWSWIINPEASMAFLKGMILATPRNKLLTFGGDYIAVEAVVGHAALARRGIALSLSSLVRDGWLSRSAAIELIEPLMRGNAHRLFELEALQQRLASAPWLGTPRSGQASTS